ncbi:hypothetical protein E1283_05555 [Streptomyces hainanensis]|uniref:Uncharacterized protein n=1 Tax=Streptomyces hainanensis TaxID=402648 RepID=A0A4R4TS57_9ACTN|nr:hypothetical protein E1283_05555 [Streptomyces hainanensis]
MGYHGPHLLQGELDASRPYLDRCSSKPLDQKDGRGVSDLHPCALPHARGIPTRHHGKAARCMVVSGQHPSGTAVFDTVRRS